MKEDYVEPKWETIYFEAPFNNGRWSATQCTVGKDRYMYYVNWYEPYSTLPPHYKLHVNYGDGATSWQICMSSEIAYSRVMAAIKEYTEKYYPAEAEKCPTCNSTVKHKEEWPGSYTYFEQTPSRY